MLQADLDRYGLHNPPAVVRTSVAGKLPRARSAKKEVDLDQWARATAEGIDKLVSAAEHFEAEDIEEAIEYLERLEQEARQPWEQLKGILEYVNGAQEQATHTPEGLQGALLKRVRRLANAVESLLSPIESVLRSYRDGRWRLMALQSEKEPSGSAPVFEDGDSLLAYLKS